MSQSMSHRTEEDVNRMTQWVGNLKEPEPKPDREQVYDAQEGTLIELKFKNEDSQIYQLVVLNTDCSLAFGKSENKLV